MAPDRRGLLRHAALAAMALSLLAVLFTFSTVSASPAHAEHTGSSKAWVRVLHASPDAPPVDILVDNAIAVHALTFGHITKYLGLAAGKAYDIKIAVAGDDDAVVKELTRVAFNTGYTTVAATGFVARSPAFSVQVFSDSSWRADSRARIRVVHLSPGAPAVDVYAKRETSEDASFAKVVSALSYPHATGYLQVKGGEYQFGVAAAASSSLVYTSPEVGLLPGRVYTAWAIGSLIGSGQGFRLLVTTDFAAL
ncbi:MAG TPA: DUF4397 domain-containing protein [Ktedonobacterales bacterium]|nr:DUF4397 domain-containing protein [Ktedonobacterales bacterium]